MLLLAGHDIKSEVDWKSELSNFWRIYLKSDPSHPMGQPGAPPKECTVPMYLHGDEGRGKYRSPLMIQAWQPAVSFKGPLFKNSSGFFSMQYSNLFYVCKC